MTCCTRGNETSSKAQEKCEPMYTFFASSPTCADYNDREKDNGYWKKVNATCDGTKDEDEDEDAAKKCRNKFENIYHACGKGCLKNEDVTLFSRCVWAEMQRAPSDEKLVKESGAV